MKKLLLVSLVLFITSSLFGQAFVANYEESAMSAYTLPDPLVFIDGSPVKTVKDWTKRRAELLNIFEQEVYGVTPAGKVQLSSSLLSENENAMDGKAIRREFSLKLEKDGKAVILNLLLFLPKTGGKFPIFLGYNFNGNHTVSADPGVVVTDSWVRNDPATGITANKSNETKRGSDIKSWPIGDIISRGYGVATLYYGDVDPDFDDGFMNGVHPLFNLQRDATSWGSIAAWSWGLSRVMDFLVKQQEVDSRKVVVLGHSRLGKAALWAGVNDQRFAIIVSNESGCGGAALSKRIYGETVGRINESFPHWFCENFRKYNRKEENLPVDQHELLALLAPRPLYVCSAEEDKWSDPKGEFLSCVGASPVYQLLGKEGFPGKELPELEHPVIGTIGYHIRPGKHAINGYDWSCFMNFADEVFKRK